MIAAAGGVVLDGDEPRRAPVADAAASCGCTADPAAAGDRVTSAGHRPWLDDDPVGTLQRMYRDREHLYREVADAVVDVDGLDVAEVVDAVVDAIEMPPNHERHQSGDARRPSRPVPLGERSYDVLVGHGAAVQAR